jgi:hypothetical protein
MHLAGYALEATLKVLLYIVYGDDDAQNHGGGFVLLTQR